MKHKVKASFTVEAALIIPVILFVIFGLIYLTFYLHDLCRLQTVADKALHKASLTVKHEADFKTGRVDYEMIGDRGVFYYIFGSTKPVEDIINIYLEEELQGEFFCTEITGIKVVVGKFKIAISVEGKFEIPMKGILDYFNPGRSIAAKVSSPVHNPAETLRTSDVIVETGVKIKGTDKLKDLLQRFIK